MAARKLSRGDWESNRDQWVGMGREEVSMFPESSWHSRDNGVVVDRRAGRVPSSRGERDLGTRGTRDAASNES